jgi:hypothetical protein
MARSSRLELSVAVALAVLVGCSGAEPRDPVVLGGTSHAAAARQFLSNSVARPGFAIAGSRALITAVSFNSCPSKHLLFISDANNYVIYIFRAGEYPRTTPCGVIAGNGLSQPQGIDLDGDGNLYVANTTASTILEFAPPYTGEPMKTLTDPGQYPAAVEADCGAYIWVTNIGSVSGGSGSLSQYSLKGTAPLHTFSDRNASGEYFPACDSRGNVFTTFRANASGLGYVNEFKAPSYTVTDLPAIVLQFPGGLDYDGKHLLVDDQIAKTITQWTPPSTKGDVISLSAASDPVTFAVARNDIELFTADAGIPGYQVWDYPSGTFDHTEHVSGAISIGTAVYGD